MIKLLIVFLLSITPVDAKDVSYQERYLMCKEINEVLQEGYEAGYITKRELKSLIRRCALIEP